MQKQHSVAIVRPEVETYSAPDVSRLVTKQQMSSDGWEREWDDVSRLKNTAVSTSA